MRIRRDCCWDYKVFRCDDRGTDDCRELTGGLRLDRPDPHPAWRAGVVSDGVADGDLFNPVPQVLDRANLGNDFVPVAEVGARLDDISKVERLVPALEGYGKVVGAFVIHDARRDDTVLIRYFGRATERILVDIAKAIAVGLSMPLATRVSANPVGKVAALAAMAASEQINAAAKPGRERTGDICPPWTVMHPCETQAGHAYG